jgi:hypothetical protein
VSEPSGIARKSWKRVAKKAAVAAAGFFLIAWIAESTFVIVDGPLAPDPTEGKTIPYNNHGTTTYVSRYDIYVDGGLLILFATSFVTYSLISASDRSNEQ